jgi:hypothetical protein
MIKFTADALAIDIDLVASSVVLLVINIGLLVPLAPGNIGTFQVLGIIALSFIRLQRPGHLRFYCLSGHSGNTGYNRWYGQFDYLSEKTAGFRMNIAIVTSYFYPWYGGITEHVYHQYAELVRRGHDVKIITPFDGNGKIGNSDDLIQIGKLMTCIVNGSVVKIPLLVGKKMIIRKILVSNRFDIVHLHQPLFLFIRFGFSFLYPF